MTPRRAALWTSTALTLAMIFILQDHAWTWVALFYAFVAGLWLGGKRTG